MSHCDVDRCGDRHLGQGSYLGLRHATDRSVAIAFRAAGRSDDLPTHQSELRALATPRWGWQIYRGFLTAGANFGFFYALAHVPIVTALLLSYIGPVLIVVAFPSAAW